MPISSRVPKGKGSETKAQACRLQAESKPLAPNICWGEDIVQSSWKRLAAQKALEGKCKVSPSGCWEWTEGKSHGYGQVRVHEIWGDRPVYAHRLSYLVHHGPIPTGLQVCHRCDNPPCINPEHLFLGTSAENLADMKSKRRHAFGERNGMTTLSDRDIAAIRLLVKNGFTQREVAKRYGISEGHMSTIIRGKKRGSASGAIRTRHGLAKLTEKQVLQVYDLHDEGLTPTEIGKRFKVADATIHCIVSGKTWKHLFSARRKT